MKKAIEADAWSNDDQSIEALQRRLSRASLISLTRKSLVYLCTCELSIFEKRWKMNEGDKEINGWNVPIFKQIN